MQEKEIVAIASEYGVKKGLEVEQYNASIDETSATWLVHFMRDTRKYAPKPGDFFTIVVDKNTRQATEIVYGK